MRYFFSIACGNRLSTLQTVMWYMNNNVAIGAAFGPTLPPGWSLVAP
jgi:hypothetical protein